MLHAFVGTPRNFHKFQAPFIAIVDVLYLVFHLQVYIATLAHMSHVKDQANRFSVGQVPLRNIVVFMVVFKIYIRYEISIVFMSMCI